MKANRKFNDSVFTALFEDKTNLLELYNAIEGTDYGLDTEIEITTLENILFMDQYNDVAFILNGRLIILYEHQLSINQNMPVRFLQYIGKEYEKIIPDKAVYQESLVKIPTPKFVVLYNGTKEYPLETTLKLSDAFIEQTDNPELELTAKVINVNYEKQNDVLSKSKTLQDYSYFVYKIREYRKVGLILTEAVEKAVLECIAENKLKKFLEENSSEVVNMLTTEFNLETAKEVWRKDTILEMATLLLDVLDVRTIAEKTGLEIFEVEELKKQKQ